MVIMVNACMIFYVVMGNSICRRFCIIRAGKKGLGRLFGLEICQGSWLILHSTQVQGGSSGLSDHDPELKWKFPSVLFSPFPPNPIGASFAALSLNITCWRGPVYRKRGKGVVSYNLTQTLEFCVCAVEIRVEQP